LGKKSRRKKRQMSKQKRGKVWRDVEQDWQKEKNYYLEKEKKKYE